MQFRLSSHDTKEKRFLPDLQDKRYLMLLCTCIYIRNSYYIYCKYIINELLNISVVWNKKNSAARDAILISMKLSSIACVTICTSSCQTLISQKSSLHAYSRWSMICNILYIRVLHDVDKIYLFIFYFLSYSLNVCNGYLYFVSQIHLNNAENKILKVRYRSLKMLKKNTVIFSHCDWIFSHSRFCFRHLCLEHFFSTKFRFIVS